MGQDGKEKLIKLNREYRANGNRDKDFNEGILADRALLFLIHPGLPTNIDFGL